MSDAEHYTCTQEVQDLRDRIRELEAENVTFRNAQKACETCDGPTIAEFKEMKVEVARLKETLDEYELLHRCDCCDCLTENVIDTGDNMQCVSCSALWKATARAEAAEYNFGVEHEALKAAEAKLRAVATTDTIIVPDEYCTYCGSCNWEGATCEECGAPSRIRKLDDALLESQQMMLDEQEERQAAEAKLRRITMLLPNWERSPMEDWDFVYVGPQQGKNECAKQIRSILKEQSHD